MAIQNSIIPFTGKLGNLIGYQRNGKYFLRSMPEIVRQTGSTRRAAHRFGMASRKGALIRNAFYDDLDIRCDSNHINRLNKTLITGAGNTAAIAGFRFNEYTGIDRFFTITPKLSKDDILHIHPQTLAQHKNITALEVKVIAVRIDFTTRQVIDTDTVILMIDNTRETFGGAKLPLNVTGSGTLLVTLQVRGLQKNDASGNRQFMAADIIAVKEPQTPKPFKKVTASRRRILKPEIDLKLDYTPMIQRE